MHRNVDRPSVELVEIVDRPPEKLRAVGEGRVVVWYARPSRWREDWRSYCTGVLSDVEIRRADRFRFKEDRELSRAAHGLLRFALAEYGDADPREWQFEMGQYGKPEIVSPKSRLQFSLSHTRDFIGCAISEDLPVGFDVEDTTRSVISEIADQYFSSHEAEFVRSGLPDNRDDNFFQIWTLKESYIKARGMGLSIPLTSFEFVQRRKDEWRIRHISDVHLNPFRWRFWSWRTSPRYRCALAVRIDRHARDCDSI